MHEIYSNFNLVVAKGLLISDVQLAGMPTYLKNGLDRRALALLRQVPRHYHDGGFYFCDECECGMVARHLVASCSLEEQTVKANGDMQGGKIRVNTLHTSKQITYV